MHMSYTEEVFKRLRALSLDLAVWERFGKELESPGTKLSRTESTGRVFLYVLITRRSSVQICPPQPFFMIHRGLLNASSKLLLYFGAKIPRIVLVSDKGVGDRNVSNLLPILKVFTEKNVALTFDRRSNN